MAKTPTRSGFHAHGAWIALLLALLSCKRSGSCTDIATDPVTKLTLSSGTLYRDQTPPPLNGRCNQRFERTFTSNASRADISAELERQLVARGFSRHPPVAYNPWLCDRRAHLEQFQRADVTVHILINPPPFPLTRGKTLQPGEAAFAVHIMVSNLAVVREKAC